MLAKLKKSGMQVNDVSPSEKAEFKKLSAPVYKEFEGRVGKDLLEKVIAANK